MWRAYSQLKSAVRAVPMCIIPVGEGAMRVTTGDGGVGHRSTGPRDDGRRGRLSTRLRRLPSAGALLRGALAEARAQVDRVFLWVPVAFGLGAAIYLGLKTEPPLWPRGRGRRSLLGAAPSRSPGAAAAGRCIAALVLAAMVAAGFSVAKLRSDHVAAPIVPAGLGVADGRGLRRRRRHAERQRPAPADRADLRSVGLTADQLPLRVRIVMPPGGVRRAGRGDPGQGAARPAAGAGRAGRLRLRPRRLVRRRGRRRPGARARRR